MQTPRILLFASLMAAAVALSTSQTTSPSQTENWAPEPSPAVSSCQTCGMTNECSTAFEGGPGHYCGIVYNSWTDTHGVLLLAQRPVRYLISELRLQFPHHLHQRTVDLGRRPTVRVHPDCSPRNRLLCWLLHQIHTAHGASASQARHYWKHSGGPGRW